MPIAAFSALLLASAPLAAADRTALDALVAGIYQPYSQEVHATPSWEYPVFSREVSALIAHWRRVTPSDEPDRLSDGDWFCLCQDWDHRAFRAAILSRGQNGRDRARLAVRVDLGHGQTRDLRMAFRREGGEWRLDDIFARDYPGGLKRTIRQTIREDEMIARDGEL